MKVSLATFNLFVLFHDLMIRLRCRGDKRFGFIDILLCVVVTTDHRLPETEISCHS